jgi:DNA oxidative demethylase
MQQRTLPLDSPAEPFPDGFRHLAGWLDRGRQGALLAEVLAAVEAAGWFRPTMPQTGRPMSVRMCNLGPLGWVTDAEGGYRYQRHHPGSGEPWPALPASLLRLWSGAAGYPAPPEACLVNLYRGEARMGLHQDRDEADLAAPVVSVSLGDDALFRVGGTSRKAPTRSLLLRSGDVVVLGGSARLCFHGVDRVLAATSDLVPGGGRVNLTLRRVTLP